MNIIERGRAFAGAVELSEQVVELGPPEALCMASVAQSGHHRIRQVDAQDIAGKGHVRIPSVRLDVWPWVLRIILRLLVDQYGTRSPPRLWRPHHAHIFQLVDHARRPGISNAHMAL